MNEDRDFAIRRLSTAVKYLITYMSSLSTQQDMQRALNVINEEFAALSVRVDALQTAVDAGQLPRYSDGEIPTGVKDGVNTIFELAHDPVPAGSCQLFVDGTLLEPGNDYTINGNAITIDNSGYIPTSGTPFLSYYKY